MKHQIHSKAALIGTLFCASAALPALAVPTGTITSNVIDATTTPDPYGGPPQLSVTATTKHKVINDSPNGLQIIYDYSLSMKSPNPLDSTNSVGDYEFYYVNPHQTTTEHIKQLNISYASGWTYTSKASLQDYNHYSTDPANWLDGSTTSSVAP